jgi:SAM-dependent methyltransferase
VGGEARGSRLLTSVEPRIPGRSRGAQRLARVMNDLITEVPWAWRLVRRPMTRFFERAAPTWDRRFASDPERIVPLMVALDFLPTPPARVLDVGTGTGAAALIAAERWPEAEVTGIDVSPAMIKEAAAKETRPGVEFRVADVSELDPGDGYDLLIMLNMPPFFAPVSGLVRSGGFVAHIASRGPTTPFYTSAEKLAEGFERHGLETVASGAAGPGTYYLARRP